MVPEPQTPAAVAQGVLQFALLIAIGEGTGLGLLAVLRLPTDLRQRLLLAPFAATMVWALTGNLLVRFGFTIAQATPILAATSLGLGALGIGSLVRARRAPRRLGVLMLVLVLPVLGVMWVPFGRGLGAHLGSHNLDTAYYTSVASGLWHYGLDVSSSGSVFFQRYAAVLDSFGRGRNHTFVLLALFSPFGEAGEPMFVRNLFVSWSFFVLASSLGFYRASWTVLETGRPTSAWQVLLYAALTMGMGWAVVPGIVGNWDNGLMVSLGPAMAGLARQAPRGPGYPVLLGMSVAYAVYTYPELAAFAMAFAAPLYLGGMAEAGRPAALRRYAVAGVTAAVLLAPGARPIWGFVMGQLAQAREPLAGRPGGPFAQGLAHTAWNPATWWVLGSEHGSRVELSWASLWGLLLAALALVGVARLARRGPRAELVSLGLVVVSVGYFALVERYGYAAYKLLSVSWWLVGRCLVEGAAALTLHSCSDAEGARRPGGRWLVRVGAVTLILGAGLVTAERVRREDYLPAWVQRQLPTLAALTRLRDAATSERPTDVLVTPSVSGAFAAPWVFYALKHTPLRPYLGEGGPKAPFPGGAAWPADGTVPETVLLPSSAARTTPRFRTPEYALVDTAETAVIESVDNPNEAEAWGQWLGTKPIRVTLLAHRGLPLALTFRAAPGPSLPDTSRRVLVLAVDSRPIVEIVIDRPTLVTLPFVTAGGREVLLLSTPDRPTVKRLPNGDRRPLLVRIEDLRIEPAAVGHRAP